MKKIVLIILMLVVMTSIVSAGTCYSSLDVTGDGTIYLREENTAGTNVTGVIETIVTNPSGVNCSHISEMYFDVKHLEPLPEVDWTPSNGGVNVMDWGICANTDNETITFIYPSQTFEEGFIEITRINITFAGFASGTYTISATAPTGIELGWSEEYDATCNTAPVINSISPSTRIELKNGESQIYTSNVTDAENDTLTYSWTIGSTEVSTSSSYTANWDDIEAGIYTLSLEVNDSLLTDTESTTLEIRAVGGSPSGSSFSIVESVEEEETDFIVTSADARPSGFVNSVRNIFTNISQWFSNLFN